MPNVIRLLNNVDLVLQSPATVAELKYTVARRLKPPGFGPEVVLIPRIGKNKYPLEDDEEELVNAVLYAIIIDSHLMAQDALHQNEERFWISALLMASRAHSTLGLKKATTEMNERGVDLQPCLDGALLTHVKTRRERGEPLAGGGAKDDDNTHSTLTPGSLLLRCGADANAMLHGRAPLHWVAQYGLYEEAVPLLHARAEIDTPVVPHGKEPNDRYVGYSPLHIACECARVFMTGLFLHDAPDVRGLINMRNLDGHTSLWCAIVAGSMDIVKLLLRKGATVELDHLNEAMVQRRSRMVDFLIPRIDVVKYNDVHVDDIDSSSSSSHHRSNPLTLGATYMPEKILPLMRAGAPLPRGNEEFIIRTLLKYEQSLKTKAWIGRALFGEALHLMPPQEYLMEHNKKKARCGLSLFFGVFHMLN